MVTKKKVLSIEMGITTAEKDPMKMLGDTNPKGINLISNQGATDRNPSTMTKGTDQTLKSTINLTRTIATEVTIGVATVKVTSGIRTQRPRRR